MGYDLAVFERFSVSRKKFFGINPGGYIGYYNLEKRGHGTYFREGDKKAESRKKLKIKAGMARRAIRYQRFGKGR